MAGNQEDDPLSRDVLLFPAFNIGSSELYYFLKSIESCGLQDRLVLVCSREFLSENDVPLKHLIVDEFDSFSTLTGKIESMRKRHGLRFRGVLGIDEELQFQLSRKLAHRFGLEFFDDATCLRASNKFLLKSSFRRYGVPTSPFLLITKPDRENALRVGFPNVLKVLSGTASHYLFYNESMDELECNCRRLKDALRRVNGDPRFRKQSVVLGGVSMNLDPKRQFLLEAYAPGDEFSCDFMIQSKEITIIRVTKKIKGPYFGYFKGYHLLNEEELVRNSVDKARLVSVCGRIARALSVRTGVCMVDFKVCKGRITVLEASIRPGLSVFNHLMYDVYGYTSLALMAMQKMGIPVDAGINGASGAVLYLYAGSNGDLEPSLDEAEFEDLKQRFNTAATHTYRESFDCSTDSEFDHSSLMRGYTLLRNFDVEAPMRRADLALDDCRCGAEELVK